MLMEVEWLRPLRYTISTLLLRCIFFTEKQLTQSMLYNFMQFLCNEPALNFTLRTARFSWRRLVVQSLKTSIILVVLAIIQTVLLYNYHSLAIIDFLGFFLPGIKSSNMRIFWFWYCGLIVNPFGTMFPTNPSVRSHLSNQVFFHHKAWALVLRCAKGYEPTFNHWLQ